MSDDDRLVDYLTRMENPEHGRTLADGCLACGHSKVYCRAVLYLEQGLCCAGCAHP